MKRTSQVRSVRPQLRDRTYVNHDGFQRLIFARRSRVLLTAHCLAPSFEELGEDDADRGTRRANPPVRGAAVSIDWAQKRPGFGVPFAAVGAKATGLGVGPAKPMGFEFLTVSQ